METHIGTSNLQMKHTFVQILTCTAKFPDFTQILHARRVFPKARIAAGTLSSLVTLSGQILDKDASGSCVSSSGAYQPEFGMRLGVALVPKQQAEIRSSGPHDLCRSASRRWELPARGGLTAGRIQHNLPRTAWEAERGSCLRPGPVFSKVIVARNS